MSNNSLILDHKVIKRYLVSETNNGELAIIPSFVSKSYIQNFYRALYAGIVNLLNEINTLPSDHPLVYLKNLVTDIICDTDKIILPDIFNFYIIKDNGDNYILAKPNNSPLAKLIIDTAVPFIPFVFYNTSVFSVIDSQLRNKQVVPNAAHVPIKSTPIFVPDIRTDNVIQYFVNITDFYTISDRSLANIYGRMLSVNDIENHYVQLPNFTDTTSTFSTLIHLPATVTDEQIRRFITDMYTIFHTDLFALNTHNVAISNDVNQLLSLYSLFDINANNRSEILKQIFMHDDNTDTIPEQEYIMYKSIFEMWNILYVALYDTSTPLYLLLGKVPKGINVSDDQNIRLTMHTISRNYWEGYTVPIFSISLSSQSDTNILRSKSMDIPIVYSEQWSQVRRQIIYDYLSRMVLLNLSK